MPAEDIFSRFRQDNFSPVSHASAVTPHNTNELTYVTRADYRADIDEIKSMLMRINDKLDDKADKP